MARQISRRAKISPYGRNMTERIRMLDVVIPNAVRNLLPICALDGMGAFGYLLQNATKFVFRVLAGDFLSRRAQHTLRVFRALSFQLFLRALRVLRGE